jgi:hypothetical protein
MLPPTHFTGSDARPKKNDRLSVEIDLDAVRTKSLDGEIGYVIPGWLIDADSEPPADRTPLHLVLTPGKVGSKTVAATLANRFGLENVAHAHFIGSYGQRVLDFLIARGPTRFNVWETQKQMALLLQQELAARRVGRTESPTFVFSAVRDPIAQAISVVFECWWLLVDAPERLTVDMASRAVLEMNWPRVWQGWYESEVREITGVDLWADAFPVKRGWQVYETDSARLVLLRYENFDTIREALTALYNDRFDGEVVAKNLTSAGPYAELYREIQSSIRLPQDFVDRALSLPYVKLFYTDAERATFRQRWLR